MLVDDFILHHLANAVNAQQRLVWQGRHLSTTLLLETGETAHLIEVTRGQVTAVKRGPFITPCWQFALRASRDDWAQFWTVKPPPGFHDVMALIKFKRLRAEGDLYPLMANLFYFKALLACPRTQGVTS